MLGVLLTYFRSFQLRFCWFCFPQVVQKQTLGKVEYWTVVCWPVVPEIFVPRIIKIGSPFKWQSIMFEMFFPDTVYFAY